MPPRGVDLLGALGHVAAAVPTAAIRSSTTSTSASVSTVRGVVHGQDGAAAEHQRAAALRGRVGHGSSSPRGCGGTDGPTSAQRSAVDGGHPRVRRPPCQGDRRRGRASRVDRPARRRQQTPRRTAVRTAGTAEEVHGDDDGLGHDAGGGPAGRAAGGRLLPHPRRAVRHDAARRPRRRGGQGRGPGRRRHPHLAAAGPGRASSTYYLGVNRNKRSVALDLKDPDDAALAQELARRADVLVENFKPGGLARFGLDYDAVAAHQPRRRLRLDQRVRQRPRRRGAARLRPDRAGHLRAS